MTFKKGSPGDVSACVFDCRKSDWHGLDDSTHGLVVCNLLNPGVIRMKPCRTQSAQAADPAFGVLLARLFFSEALVSQRHVR